MVVHGIVKNGTIVFDGEVALPEGAVVAVTFPVESPLISAIGTRRVKFPLVISNDSGVWDLTSEQIGSILDEDEISR